MDVVGIDVVGMDVLEMDVLEMDKESLSALRVLLHIHPKTTISNP